MYKTAADLANTYSHDPLRLRAEAAAARRAAQSEMDRIIDEAGDDGLTASQQRAFDKAHRNAAELDDLAEQTLGKVLDKIAGQPVSEPAAKRTDGAPSTGTAAFGAVLHRDASFGDLPGQKRATDKEAASWLHDRLLDKRALGESADAAGGFAVPTAVSATIIDIVRRKQAVIAAGAQVVPLDSDTHRFPRLETVPVPNWVAENVAMPEGDPTLGAITFNAKALALMTRVSWELLQDAPGLEPVLLDVLTKGFAEELDRVALYGSGTGEVPRGLANIAGIPTTAFGGANGAAPTNWALVGRAIQAIRTRNYTPSGVILAPRTEGDLSNLTAGDGSPIEASDYVKAVPRYETGIVPTNLTVGTSTDTSELFAGEFGQLLIGVRLNLTLRVLQERYAEFKQVGVVGFLRADVQVNRIDGFQRVTGIRPTA